jgi:acetyl esterase
VTGRPDPAVGITFGTAPARDDHEIPLRIYRPRALRDSRTDVPVVMWFHGGGWVLGNVVDYDPICTFLAAQVGAVVVVGRLPDGARAPRPGGGERLRGRHDLGGGAR